MASALGLAVGSIRVRSDSEASGFLKRNRAAAATLDGSTILVRPERQADPAVMAHELAHVAQLRRGGVGSVQGAERGAHAAALSIRLGVAPSSVGPAAPPPLFLDLDGGGEFDKALQNAYPGDAVIRLLRKSKTFMAMIRELDDHYVWFGNPALATSDRNNAPGGVVAKGRFASRRVLFIQTGAGAGIFIPYGSPDATISSDIIKIPGGSVQAEIARSLAHEATHALHAIKGKAPPAAFADKVAAGVTEEIDTRANEVKVGRELFPKTGTADRDALEAEVAAGYMDRPLVERDIAPDVGLTYLENSTFGALLDEAQVSDGISAAEAEAIREQMDKEPAKGATFPMVKGPPGAKGRTKLPPAATFPVNSSYALVYTNRKIALATWRAWRTKFAGREDSADAQKEKERLLQDNAHSLLDGRITYTSLPKPP